MIKSILKKLTVSLVFITTILVSSCVSLAAEDDLIDLGCIKKPIESVYLTSK